MRALFDTLALDTAAVLDELSSQLQWRYLFVYYPVLVKSVESACPAVAATANIGKRRCGRLYPDAEHLLCCAARTTHA